MKKVFRFSAPFILAFLLLGITFILAGSSNLAKAALAPSTIEGEIVVTTLEDEFNNDGDCSLREAVSAANSNNTVDACPAGNSASMDIITFAVKGTIDLTSQLEMNAGGPMAIFGGRAITLSGGNSVGVFYVHPGAIVTLSGLTITNGHSAGGWGGIKNDGILTVTNSTVSNNIADSNGGGIQNTSILTVTHSILSGNTSISQGGGGIDNWKSREDITPTLYVAYSTLLGNTSGGAINNWLGIVTITNSTLSGNTSKGNGGAVCNWKDMKIINSTLSGNHAENGGAIFYWGTTLAITNSTIVDNFAMEGAGGLLNGSGIPATVHNSIIANSVSGSNCSGMPLGGESNNLEDTDTCGFKPANGSLPNTNPMLGLLQSNGGPTQTYALLEGSPAIDAGENSQCPLIDQRGFPRPFDGNGDGLAVCDIGAYEYGSYLINTYIPIIVR